MRFPWDDLGLGDTTGEDVEGAFTCQHIGCYDTVNEAKYFDDVSLLTWKCNNGHKNKVEDFHVD